MKKLIKTISLITALLLTFSLLVTFASCNKDDSDEKITTHTDNTEKPTDNAEKPTEAPTEKPTEEVKVDPPVEISAEMQSEIKNKYFEKTYEEKNKEYYNSPDEVVIMDCYGIFDDAYCIMITCSGFMYLDVMTEVQVGEYTFVFSSSNTMKVYCNGEFYGLEQAYEKGILDDAELESLHYYYTKSEMEHYLKTTYFRRTYDEKYKDHYNSPDQVTIEACYGIFDDAYCAIITYPLVAYTCVETEVEVGGYTFVFGSSNTMIVYCDGQIYSLEKAYEKGILDDAELESLYNYYMKTRGW